MKINLHNGWADAAMPIFGAACTFAFAPFALFWLCIPILAVLLKAVQSVGQARAFGRGFLFGAGMFLSGTYWVFISVHDFGGAPVFGAALLTLFFALFWALFPAVTAWLINTCKPFNLSMVDSLAVACLWVLVEYVRGALLLNGFPWMQAAYSQIESPLAGFIPLVGSYGTTFVVIFCAAMLASIRSISTPALYPLIFVIAVHGVGQGLRCVQWTEAGDKPISVTLIQGNVSQDKKWQSDYRIKTMRNYQKLTEQHWDSDVVVWPETAIPAYERQVEEFYLSPLEQLAIANNTDIIVGLPAKGKALSENYNRALTLGKQRGVYNKNHLLPFGEYMPLQPISDWVMDALGVSLGNFVPGGDQQKMMIAGGYPFAMSICYEDAFASVFINHLPQAAYLVNITNDAWFGDSLEPYQHMQIAQMRALETGRYLLRATNTGLTGIVDSKGVLIKQAPLFKQATLSGKIYPVTGMTPFAYLGDQIVIAIVGLILIICFSLTSLSKNQI